MAQKWRGLKSFVGVFATMGMLTYLSSIEPLVSRANSDDTDGLAGSLVLSERCDGPVFPQKKPSIQRIPRILAQDPKSDDVPPRPESMKLLYSSEDMNEGQGGCGIERPIRRGNVEIGVGNDCGVRVRPTFELTRQNENRAREFSFSADGSLLVFVGTDDSQKLSQATGSRTFTLLPRKKGPIQIFETDQGDIKILTGSGALLSVDPQRAMLKSVDGYELRETLEVNAKSPMGKIIAAKGGIELRPTPGSNKSLLDYGWRTGNLAYTAAGATAHWYGDREVAGKLETCQIKASHLFKIQNEDNYSFRYASDDALAEVLKKHCLFSSKPLSP